MNNLKSILLCTFSLFFFNVLSGQIATNYDNKTIAQKTTLGRLEIKEAIAFSENPFIRRNLMTTEMFFTQLNTLNFDAMSGLFSNEFKQHAADVPDGFDGFQNYVETKDNGSVASWNHFVDLNIIMGEQDHIVTMRKGSMNNVVFDIMKFNDSGLLSASWTYSQIIPIDATKARLMYDVSEEFARPIQENKEKI